MKNKIKSYIHKLKVKYYKVLFNLTHQGLRFSNFIHNNNLYYYFEDLSWKYYYKW
jgi:hypothetical protein